MIKNNDHNNLENLLTNDAFCQWVSGFSMGNNKTFWDNWLAENPDNLTLVTQAKSIISAFDNPNEALLEAEIDSETARIWETIEAAKIVQMRPNRLENVKKMPKIAPKMWTNWLKLAASVALLVAAGLWFFSKNTTRSTPSVLSRVEASKTAIYNVTTDTTVRFSDGSTAQLKRGSSIEFDKNFAGTQRIVTLHAGEAFFEVTKNAEKPFVVYANDIVTKVLGTSFVVRTSNTEGGISSVVVRTGRVAVFKKADFAKPETETKDSVLLLPNQQVSRKTIVTPLVISLAELPILLEKPVENPEFTFENAPIVDILKTLEKAYGVKIDANEAVLKTCRLTISLGHQDTLFDKLSVICKVINANYEVLETKIRLNGKGC
jgi:transmembrane sensor